MGYKIDNINVLYENHEIYTIEEAIDLMTPAGLGYPHKFVSDSLNLESGMCMICEEPYIKHQEY
jgi:hypothetical protein